MGISAKTERLAFKGLKRDTFANVRKTFLENFAMCPKRAVQLSPESKKLLFLKSVKMVVNALTMAISTDVIALPVSPVITVNSKKVFAKTGGVIMEENASSKPVAAIAFRPGPDYNVKQLSKPVLGILAKILASVPTHLSTRVDLSFVPVAQELQETDVNIMKITVMIQCQTGSYLVRDTVPV